MRCTDLSGCKRSVLIIVLLIIGVWSQCSFATWTGAYGYSTAGGNICPVTADTNMSPKVHSNMYVKSVCSFDVGEGNAVPESGQYSLILFNTSSPGNAVQKPVGSAMNSPLYISADQELSDLSLSWSGQDLWQGSEFDYMCYALKSMSTGKIYKFNSTPQSCEVVDGNNVLPPGPNIVKCSFNNGNALNVTLGDIVRSEIGAVPGSIPSVEQKLDVTCTGDGTATYSVQFQYTAINISGDELVSTSSNGLAVAVSFNDELINTMDTYTRTYSTGSQSESLKFEPVRNPSVKVSEIPTGAFTASAVMVITVQ